MEKPKKEFRKYIGHEDNLQISIAVFLNSLGLLWWGGQVQKCGGLPLPFEEVS